MQKSVLWAEDLEGHRQPSLYYLSEEEGADGPHLVCDWNGPPTNFDDFDLDTLSMFREHDAIKDDEKNKKNDNVDFEITGDNFIDYPNPAADLIKVAQNGDSSSTQFHRQNDLDLSECAHLDFLSVPPISGGLLKRIVRNLQNIKAKQQQQPQQQRQQQPQQHQPQHQQKQNQQQHDFQNYNHTLHRHQEIDDRETLMEH